MAERIIVGISGASGIVYGVRALQLLCACGIETHLVMTKSAELTLHHELDMSRSEIEALATRTLEAYRKLLDDGGAILHFEEADLFLPAARVADTLIPTLDLLEEASTPIESKRLRLSEYWKGSPIVESGTS